MLLKLFFVLLVMLYGALMFIGGTIAPDSIRLPTARIAQQVTDQLPLFGKKAEAPATAAAPDKAAAQETPVPQESLLLPSPLPAQGAYALQIGQFSSPEAAELLRKRAAANNLAVRILATVDRQGQNWWLTVITGYTSPDEAKTQRPAVAQLINGIEEAPILLLPPSPPAPAKP